MEKNNTDETSIPLNPDPDTRKHGQREVPLQPTRLSRYLLVVGTGVGVILFIVEVCLVAFMVKSITDLQVRDKGSPGDTYNYHSPQTQSTVTFENCNQSSLCPVIRHGNFATLLKLMHGMKRQHYIRKNNNYQLKSRIRNNCEHFTISDCRGGPLRWIPDFHGSQQESNGSVTIRANGMYGMYNIFTLSSLHRHHVTIAHRVHLETYARSWSNESVLFERDIVLSAERPSFDASTFFDFVYLREGDRVFPTISNTSFLYGMQKANMWGVFQLR